ncbi:RNA polymerase sigma factor [Streptomyces sp. CA-111067]|uniref:RNA polymerase sigma factor n=1 Tax=Streptomyces sp. CA-111067 TaxID=3240046 RepID=UPI003D966F7F
METDEDLLTRSVREPTAFEPLVTRHARALHGYLARRAPDAVEDLLAEVWLQAFTGRETYDAKRGTPRMWLFGVARNVLLAHWRRRAYDVRELPGDEAGSDPWHAVDDRLDAAAAGPQLRRSLARLPQLERELLLLVAWEQLTPTEAAAVVGISPGTARSRLFRARSRLRKEAHDSPQLLRLAGDFA